jgi:HSP20 family protein
MLSRVCGALRPTGTFARQLTLDQVGADYADGVLTLRIPVAEAAKPRRISVTHTAGNRSIEGEVAEPAEVSHEPLAS